MRCCSEFSSYLAAGFVGTVGRSSLKVTCCYVDSHFLCKYLAALHPLLSPRAGEGYLQ